MRRIILLGIFALFTISIFAQTSSASFFQAADKFFATYVKNDLVDYTTIANNQDELNTLLNSIANFPDDLSPDEEKAFLINAYNIFTIKGIVDRYPIASPKEIPTLFDLKQYDFRGEKWSLNKLEKDYLLKKFPDARLHFVLVCAAKGCPPLVPFAYTPEILEAQLEQQTKLALQRENIVSLDTEEKQALISSIFLWYEQDFKPNGGVRSFINNYLNEAIPNDYNIRHSTYDWTLNDSKLQGQGQSMQRFMASQLLTKQQMEIKVFNALYTQQSFNGFSELNSRSTYFSTFGQFLFGTNRNLNWGFDVVYKSNLENDFNTASPFNALRFQRFSDTPILSCSDPNHIHHNGSFCTNEGISPSFSDSLRNSEGIALTRRANHGLAHIGPKIRINPFKKWKNLSLQQTVYIPIDKSIDGQLISFTQFFYDHTLSPKSTLFVEASLWTPISPNFRVSPFFKVFYSYFPTNRFTIYAMTTIPFEYGLGTKYSITDNLEVELLYTHYAPIEFYVGENRPNTFNLGLRYTIL